MVNVSKRLATDEGLKAIADAIKNTETVHQAKAEIQAEGAAQVQVVQNAAQEIAGKVEQIQNNTDGITELKSDLVKLENAEEGTITSRLSESITDIKSEYKMPYSMLFGKNSMESGTINQSDGQISNSDSSYRTKEFIQLKVVDKLYVYGNYSSGAIYFRPCFYDANKVFISSPGGKDMNGGEVSFSVPANAKYMKFVIAYVTLNDIENSNLVVTFYGIPSSDDINITENYRAKNVTRMDNVGIANDENVRSIANRKVLYFDFDSMAILKFESNGYAKIGYKNGTGIGDGVYVHNMIKIATPCTYRLPLTSEYKYVFVEYQNERATSGTCEVYTKRRESTQIFVASNEATEYEKMNADYVCDGINDEYELQEAIKTVEKKGGGIVHLTNGKYIIDNLYDTKSDAGKLGIYIDCSRDNNSSVVTLKGDSMPNLVYYHTFTNCPRIELSDRLFKSLGHGERVDIIGVLPKVVGSKAERVTVGGTLCAENIAINIQGIQKPIIGINGEWAYNMALKNVHCGRTFYSDFDNKEIRTDNLLEEILVSNTECVGIRGVYGYNWGSGFRIDDCNVRGWAVGFDIAGEHLVMIESCARFANIGFRFGHYGDDTMFAHPVTMINCCEEWNTHGMVFERGQQHPYINIIDFNSEVNDGLYEGETPRFTRFEAAKEEIKGNYRGNITYTTVRNSYTNAPGIAFWENDGSGINFITRNINDDVSGTTSKRPEHPQRNQQYYDTSINKLIMYVNERWVDAMGNAV